MAEILAFCALFYCSIPERCPRSLRSSAERCIASLQYDRVMISRRKKALTGAHELHALFERIEMGSDTSGYSPFTRLKQLLRITRPASRSGRTP
jgi:hypothetical protein